MKYYFISLLLVWSGNLLAEGGAYWDAEITRNPLHWFESADQLCQVVYDWKYPKGFGPYGNYPKEYKTYEYLGPEHESDERIICRMEVCRKYANYDDVTCGPGYYVKGSKKYCRDQTIPDYSAEECYPRYHVTAPAPPPCPDALEGDPVDPLTGNLVLNEVDIPGSDGMAFTRYYSSMDLGQAGSNLGINWTHNSAARIEKTNGKQTNFPKSRAFGTPEAACRYGWQDIYKKAFGGRLAYSSSRYRDGACEVLGANGEVKATLSLIPDRKVLRKVPYRSMAVIRPNGGRYYFHKETTGSWSNLHGKPVQLIENGQSWTLTLGDGTTETYGPNGKIQQVNALGGDQTLYAYNSDNQLIQVTHPNGQTTDFEYLDGRISRVTTPGGSVSYGYDAKGNLTQVIYPDNTSKQYRYEDPKYPNLLTGIIDEKGDLIATWSYDDLGRVTMNERAAGTERYSFTYSRWGDTTTVTDIAGASRTYRSDIVNGRVIYNEVTGDRCDHCGHDTDQKRSYDDKGRILNRTDWNGVTTTYERDATGLELSRTEAADTTEARTTTTEWHPQFNKPTRITEPNRITEYTYDAAGRVLSKTERTLP
jgi:YD repeat-containing protein